MAELPSGTVTFLLTDVEGSTALWEEAPVAMRVALARHDALLRAAIVEHGGHIVKTTGDGFHAAFARAPDAVGAALAAQRRFLAESWGKVGPLRVRMALHTGEAEERDGDYYGPPLNRVARLLATGHGDQVLLSDATAGLVRDALPKGADLLDLGEHRLKDLVRPERVFQLAAPDLPTGFAPLRTLDARRHNLPTHPTALLGRERELAELRRLFEGGARLVTLTGPGGTGKTRLGLQVAADLLDDFAHGVFLVELAPISDPALVPSAIVQALGVRDVGNRPIIDAVKDYLRARSLLFLLDNFEQVLPAASVVADLMAACPGLAVLATSREPLRLRGEHEYAVPPLMLPDAHQGTTPEVVSRSPAVALFVQRARAIRADFALTEETASVIAEICACLDGLPLAIELAAARTRLLTPWAIRDRIDRRLSLLMGGPQDLPDRQRTLRNTIAWSYDLLDEHERRLFRWLAVFVGGWTLEGTQAVSDPGDHATVVLDRLESLAAKSLISRIEGADGEPRFGMLEMIREYAFERLESSGEAGAIQRRHAGYYLQLAEEAEPNLTSAQRRLWLERLESEQHNLQAALCWTDESGEVEHGLRLAGALGWFWYFCGRWSQGREWLIRLLTPAYPTDRSRSRAKALCSTARLARYQDDLEGARALVDESVAIWREVGDTCGLAHALNVLGLVAWAQGDLRLACSSYVESGALFREVADGWGIGQSLLYLGAIAALGPGDEARAQLAIPNRPYHAPIVAMRPGDETRARELLEESRDLFRRLGDGWSLGAALLYLGIVARRRGETTEARAHFAESLALFREAGDNMRIALALLNLGDLALCEHDATMAAPQFAEGIALCQKLGNHVFLVECLAGLAGVAEGEGLRTRAARLSGAAAALLEASVDDVEQVDPVEHDHHVVAARAKLHETALVAAWAEGRAMSLEQAVAYALDEQPSV